LQIFPSILTFLRRLVLFCRRPLRAGLRPSGSSADTSALRKFRLVYAAAKLEFREIRDRDLESVFEVRGRTRENAISREQLAAMGITPATATEGLRSGDEQGWVCLDKSSVVGFCIANAKSGEVLVLAILPEYEGRGIGRGLLNRAVAWLRSQGARRLWLAASPDPTCRAHGFYRSQGWTPSGERQKNGDEILVWEEG
jgi:GNAT superfamily N-acetyltransferase